MWSAQGLKVGVFTKDNFTGDFVDGWNKAMNDANLEMVRYGNLCIHYIVCTQV